MRRCGNRWADSRDGAVRRGLDRGTAGEPRWARKVVGTATRPRRDLGCRCRLGAWSRCERRTLRLRNAVNELLDAADLELE